MDKKPLETLCLSDGDCATLFKLFLQTDPASGFKNSEELAAHLANPETLRMIRNVTVITDEIRKMGYEL